MDPGKVWIEELAGIGGFLLPSSGLSPLLVCLSVSFRLVYLACDYLFFTERQRRRALLARHRRAPTPQAPNTRLHGCHDGRIPPMSFRRLEEPISQELDKYNGRGSRFNA